MASEGAEHPTRDMMVPPPVIIGGSSSAAESAPERLDTGGGDNEGGLGAKTKRRRAGAFEKRRHATISSPKQVSGALPFSVWLVLDGLTSTSASHCRVGASCIAAIRQVVVLTSDGDMCDMQGTCAVAVSTGGNGALSTQPPPRTRCQHSGLSTLSVDGEGGRCDGPTDRDRCCVQEIDALVRDVVTDNPLPERVYAGWRDAAERSAATLDVGKKGAQYARGLKMWGEHPRGTSLSSPCLANAH